jgi:hypothetical protein
MPYLLNALSMLVQVVFGAIATLFLCRVAAEATRADFHNPLYQSGVGAGPADTAELATHQPRCPIGGLAYLSD